MSTIITRLYKTDQNAFDAASQLKKVGFQAADINVVTSSAAGAGGILAAISKGDVPASHAKVYAEHVSRGAALVTVNAPVFTYPKAIQALNRFHPIESGVADPDLQHDGDSSGYSNILRSSPTIVLLDGDRYFSNLFGLPLIIKDGKPASSASSGKPSATLLSGTLSSWIGLPTITQDRR